MRSAVVRVLFAQHRRVAIMSVLVDTQGVINSLLAEKSVWQ